MALEQQLVDEALAASAVMHQQIFEFFETLQMTLKLCVAPLGDGRTSRRLKRKSLRSIFCRWHSPRTISSMSRQQPPRLRRQFVERTPQHFFGELVGDADVVRA